jgi:beta-mannosidase
MHCEPGLGLQPGCSAKPFNSRWVPATVPGDVHLDYLAAGLIDDPYLGVNVDHCRWMEDMDFWYECEITAPAVGPAQRLMLDFAGLDVFATIFLNGAEIGRHANMFTPLRIDVTNLVVEGSNLLHVLLASPVLPPGRDLATSGVVGFGNRVRLQVRKMQCGYGWNAMPRLISVGIWKPVSWVILERVEIADVFVRTLHVNNSGLDGAVSAELEVLTTLRGDGAPGALVHNELEIAGQKLAWHVRVDAGVVEHAERVVVSDALLWWPAGHGEQPLYQWALRVSRDGVELDRADGRYGIRTVDLVQEPDEGGTSFRVDVNGKPVFLKGMNWSPADAIPARVNDARYHELLDACQGANINALRVWGGGVYEHDYFYDHCDELGILVTHDFMFACGAYPQDSAFLAECRAEAEVVVIRLRRHPSLVLWFGDNENDQVAEKDLAQPDYRFHSPLSKVVLAEVVARFAPGTPYVPTSPYSPVRDDQNSPLEGDSHVWGHGNAYNSEFYTSLRPRMITEIGYLAMPDLEVIEAWLTAGASRWPIWHREYLVHGTDTMRLDQDGRYRHLWANIRELGWEEPADLIDLIKKSQQSQTEASEFWIDFYGSQPQCWGIFLWNLADCWPEMSDAYIAYPMHPKPALEAVRRAYARLDR